MNIVHLVNVEKSYGTRLLFKEVNATFTTDAKVGLIGINGTGKSTFLRLIVGEIEPDRGTVERNGKASIYVLPQAPQFEEEQTILENIFLGDHPLLHLVREYELLSRTPDDPRYMRLLERMDLEDGWKVEQQARTILTKLDLSDFDRPVRLLSGGQRRRLALAQALIFPCDLLLLDEPTNHLDEASIEWLEQYLKERKGGLVLSTHDRYFLDAVCNQIMELSQKRMYQFNETYEEYVALRDTREAQLQAIEDKRKQLIRHELEWVRRGAKARTTKQKARLQRFEALTAMENRQRADTLDPIILKRRLGKKIFDFQNVTFQYDEQTPIIQNFTYNVIKHDRIGIVGPNGVGKSTLMKLIDGQLTPTEGVLQRGDTVRIAHYTQELPLFKENQRVLDYIRENRAYLPLHDGTNLSAGQLLERFLFPPEQHGVLIEKLSGGERKRLYLLKLLMDAPNVLLLDEPTNDLDIPTIEVLEDFLDTFGGVVITVCHDRYFLDRVVDKLFVFKGDGQVELYHGSYSDYEAERKENAMNEASSANKGMISSKYEREGFKGTLLKKGNSLKDDVDLGDTQSNQMKSSKLTLKEEEELKTVERRIAEIEGLMKAYDAMISHMGSDYERMESIVEEKKVIEAELEKITMRWFELAERH